jgi:transketolase
MEYLNDFDCINNLRILACDMVQNANSGHPGMPLGCAPILYVLFKNHLNFNPYDINWLSRDRFVLSNGHGCALLYSILHMFQYDISMKDLKNFRKLGSITPGHPEKGITPGIEVTTGPLGQGIANGVGMALASKHLISRFNTNEIKLIDNYIYVMCGDGCLMEGITNESVSLAGHLKLNNLILLYDDNSITIDGSTDLCFTENTKTKYESLGWKVLLVENANTNILEIDNCINIAKTSNKPTLICMKTTIGYGSDKENSEKSHGAPLGIDSLKSLKKKFQFDESLSFQIKKNVKEKFLEILNLKIKKYDEWKKILEIYKVKHKEKYDELMKIQNCKIPNISDLLNKYESTDSPLATRQISGNILKNIYKKIPQLIGGSADLSTSNNTSIDNSIQRDNYSNRYINYGIREHAMGGIANGMSTFGLIPYVGTFLVFINYFLASIRLSALSKHQVIYILTHDSIGLGEDGPTHQPIESLTILRSIPNCLTFRPADGNETNGCYIEALKNNDKPSCLCLSRQALPQLDNSSSSNVSKGAYILFEPKMKNKLDLIILSTGSEVSLCLEAIKELSNRLNIRLVSMPCIELFEIQNKDYKDMILPNNIKKLSVEAGSTLGWYKYADICYGIDSFGLSGKATEVFNYFGFSKNKLIDFILNKV